VRRAVRRPRRRPRVTPAKLTSDSTGNDQRLASVCVKMRALQKNPVFRRESPLGTSASTVRARLCGFARRADARQAALRAPRRGRLRRVRGPPAAVWISGGANRSRTRRRAGGEDCRRQHEQRCACATYLPSVGILSM
jgi:hypothetical protein